MSRPMTSRQAHRAYLDARRGPRMSKAEERRMEKEEQERIQAEMKQKQALARAQAARERKRAKEEEARREKRRRGEPTCTVTASQGMISGFLRRAGGGLAKGCAGRGGTSRSALGREPEGVVGRLENEITRDAGRSVPDVPGWQDRDEFEKNAIPPGADVLKDDPPINVVDTTKGSCQKDVTGRGSGDGTTTVAESHVANASKDNPRTRAAHPITDWPQDTISGDRPGDENKNHADSTLEEISEEAALNCAPGNSAGAKNEKNSASFATNPTSRNTSNNAAGIESVGVGGELPEDGSELDDLFLSASQLAREVEGDPGPTRKRSRDEAFAIPDLPLPKQSGQRRAGMEQPSAKPVSQNNAEMKPLPPPAKQPRQMKRDPRILTPPPQQPPGHRSKQTSVNIEPESYDLGISSQELLQIEAQGDLSLYESPPKRLSPWPDPEKPIPEPPGEDISFSDPFDLCSQDLREIDALADIPLEKQPNHPTTANTGTTTTADAIGNTKGSDNDKDSAAEAPHEKEARGEEQEDDDEEAGEPQRFFTGSTQELIALAEHRSRETAADEDRRRRIAAKAALARKSRRHHHHKAASAPKPEETGPGRRHKEPANPARLGDAGEAAARKEGGGRRGSVAGTLRRSSSFNFDDDAWWADLDNTDLEALLAPPHPPINKQS